jgi:hypothetical protein
MISHATAARSGYFYNFEGGLGRPELFSYLRIKLKYAYKTFSTGLATASNQGVMWRSMLVHTTGGNHNLDLDLHLSSKGCRDRQLMSHRVLARLFS